MWLIIIIELVSIQAFVISPTLHIYGSISSLSYGPSRQDDINEEEKKDTISSAIENDFQKQLNDPACDIDDEDCIEFSLALNSNINEVSFILWHLFVANYIYINMICSHLFSGSFM